jgi:hypothetical protein
MCSFQGRTLNLLSHRQGQCNGASAHQFETEGEEKIQLSFVSCLHFIRRVMKIAEDEGELFLFLMTQNCRADKSTVPRIVNLGNSVPAAVLLAALSTAR